MTGWMRELGHVVNHKHVERLMRMRGLQAIVPGPNTSRPHPKRRVYPYLLHGLKILAPGGLWRVDITYAPMRRGYLCLVAVVATRRHGTCRTRSRRSFVAMRWTGRWKEHVPASSTAIRARNLPARSLPGDPSMRASFRQGPLRSQ